MLKEKWRNFTVDTPSLNREPHIERGTFQPNTKSSHGKNVAAPASALLCLLAEPVVLVGNLSRTKRTKLAVLRRELDVRRKRMRRKNLWGKREGN